MVSRTATFPTLAADVQKWTDANGRVHYGDEPPPGTMTRHISTPNGSEVSPDQEVQVAESVIRTYAVSGTTVQELNAASRANGPFDSSNGKRWSGRAKWNLRWKDTYAREGGTCGIDTFSVTLSTTIELPNWIDRNAAPDSLKSKWDQFARMLRVHEDGHKENGIKAANDLANRLRALAPERDCEALNRRIEALGQRIISEYRYLDQAYDRATNHGVNQGATLY